MIRSCRASPEGVRNSGLRRLSLASSADRRWPRAISERTARETGDLSTPETTLTSPAVIPGRSAASASTRHSITPIPKQRR